MEKLVDGYGLIEGPVWDAKRQGLFFTDVPNGGVFFYSTITGKTTHTSIKRKGIGGMALHKNGGLVVGGRNIAYKAFTEDTKSDTSLPPICVEETVIIRGIDKEGHHAGYNDFTVAPNGDLVVGGFGEPPFGGPKNPLDRKPGKVYWISPIPGAEQNSSSQVAEGVLLTNGMQFSPDRRRVYHSDTSREAVMMYSADPSLTVLGDKTKFADIAHPDGLAVAVDGSVFVADAGQGEVVRFNPDGSVQERLPVPQPFVTSCCFGGDGLEDLFVVTGPSKGYSGTVYRTKPGVAGLSIPEAAVAVGAGVEDSVGVDTAGGRAKGRSRI